MNYKIEAKISNQIESIFHEIITPFLDNEKKRINTDIIQICNEFHLIQGDVKYWLKDKIFSTMNIFQSNYEKLYLEIETYSNENFLVRCWVGFYIHKTKNSVIESLIKFQKHILEHYDKSYTFPNSKTDDYSWKSVKSHFENFNINDTIENITFEFKNKIAEKRIQIELDLAPFPITLFHVPYLTAETITELINNAINTIGSNGTIMIKTVFSHDNSLLLIFSDNGKGIPTEIINNIFNEDYPENNKSIGKGLSLIKFYIEDVLNGNISIMSHLNKGTNIYIKMPLQQEND